MRLVKISIVYANVLWLFLALWLGFSSAQSLTYRLDKTVLPDIYDITIKPYLLPEDGDKQFSFDGQVNITLRAVAANISNITLHQNNDYIELKDTLLYDARGKLVPDAIRQLDYEESTNFLTVQLNETLQANASYTLYFRYVGQIRDGQAGFYKSSYIDVAGKQTWIGITQAQRIDARTIFPCFDEPAMKAVFKMHISRPRAYTSRFNTQLLNSVPDDADRYMDYFEATPRMSTYLVAFLISKFESRGNVTLSIITRPEYYNKTAYSNSVAERALSGYDNYTQLPYKTLGNLILQQVGAPTFPHNGMENWGLIMYKDAVLVQEPGYTDGWSHKQYSASIIVHEISHMWFGDSVTFAWWSYFWLNEAFARYFEYYFTHQLYPEFEMDQQFLVNQMHTIFVTDALNSTQPLSSSENSVQSPEQIAHKFSAITYAKGACIVRMFRNSMGHPQFDSAIRAYLREYHLKNTLPADLFKHLKEHWPHEQGVDLDKFFTDWTEQVGYPVLNVTVSSDRKSVSLSQKRFLLESNDSSDATIKYTIPITYTDDNEPNFTNLTPRFYLNITQDVLNLSFRSSLDWIIFNVQQTGYYRVFYDLSTLNEIKKALLQPQHSGIPTTNRAQLIDDLYSFAQMGALEYDVVFDFLEYLALETDYLPWYAAFSGLTRIAQRTPLERQKDLGAFVLDVSATVYKKLHSIGTNDTVLDVYNRNKVVKWVCKYHGKKCEDDVLNAYTTMKHTSIKPVPDFRETVYCSMTRVGYDAQFFYLYDQYIAVNLTSEKEMILRAMGCARMYRLISQYYALILSKEVPVEYKQNALSALYSENPENVTPVFNMIRKTIEKLAEALGGWSSTADVIRNIANYFTNQQQKTALVELIEQQSENWGTSITKLRNAVATVDNNLQWSELRLGSLFKYLDHRNGAVMCSISNGMIFLAILFFCKLMLS